MERKVGYRLRLFQRQIIQAVDHLFILFCFDCALDLLLAWLFFFANELYFFEARQCLDMGLLLGG